MSLQMALDLALVNVGASAVRSGVRDSRDFYPTPYGLIDSALDLVREVPRRVLDAGAGQGRWGRVARRRWPGAWIVGVDAFFPSTQWLHSDWFHEDFRARLGDRSFDLVVTNPPFSLAEEFIALAHTWIKASGQIVALLALDFLASQDRARGFWRQYPPASVHILGRRPSFSGDGGTGNFNCMLVTWRAVGVFEPALEIGRMWDYSELDGE